MKAAFIVAFAYLFIMNFRCAFFSLSVLNRPLIIGTVLGCVLGDIRTGIIMGGMLEGVYMGVSAIGGVTASNAEMAAAVAVPMTILTDMNMETGLALAVTIGVVTNSLNTVFSVIPTATNPAFMKLAEKGKFKKFFVLLFAQQWGVGFLSNFLPVFLVVWIGADLVNAAIAWLPVWVLTGLDAAGKMLAVVGFALIAKAIWNNMTLVFIVLGFCMAQYVGLDTLPIAAIGFVIAYIVFMNEKEKNLCRQPQSSAANEEGDDFFE